MISAEEATTRVARGAAHLDRVRPGWAERIDIGTLNLQNPCRCMVGQLCGTGWEFTMGLLMLSLSGFEDDAVAMGFDLPSHDGLLENYAILQDAWVSAIADRRLSSVTTQPEAVRCEVAR